jgi:hypothetical protein
MSKLIFPASRLGFPACSLDFSGVPMEAFTNVSVVIAQAVVLYNLPADALA